MRTLALALLALVVSVPGTAQMAFGPTTPFEFTRFDAEYFPPDGMVYVLGGRLASGSTPDTDGSIWRFNPKDSTWTDTGVDMPTPVSNQTICYYQPPFHETEPNRAALIITGGRPEGGGSTNVVQWYFPENDSFWTDATDPLPYGNAYAGYAAVQYGQDIYVTGGFSTAAPPYHMDSLFVYNPAGSDGNRWSVIPTAILNTARSYVELVAVDGLLYAIGGEIYDGATLTASPVCEILNPADPSPTWNDAAMTDLPSARGEGRAFGYSANLDGLHSQYAYIYYYAGGAWPDEDSLVYRYDILFDSWDQPFALSDPRRNHAGTFIHGTEWSAAYGMPAYWVFGGRQVDDATILNTSEYHFIDPGYLFELRYDFEADDGGFVHGGTNDSWQWGAPDPTYINGPDGGAFRSVNCWGTNLLGMHNASEESYLESPLFAIPAGASKVHLWMAQYVTVFGDFDAVNAKISVDGGAYQLLTPAAWARQYDDVSLGSHWMNGDSIWNSDDSLFWDMMCFDLTPYTGSTVRLRCNLGTTTVVHRPGYYVDDVVLFSDIVVGVEDDRWTVGPLPNSFALHPNRPNPFNPTTTIAFDLPVQCDVRLDVYDVLGRKAATLIEGSLPAGNHSVVWDASFFASGTYFARLTTDEYTSTHKMVLVK